ncbi:importin subunit alpha-1-like [Arabidopsis lyrata subsp. lyrata]|uniref:importin subunit alpha-1-like n=1 Tax=Arabidopsis lyrata subsp. lyrata TaxID=81972 RepID=UPI000A29D32A|nr:importin subunit alpha-1-like [Arabidopsis lyrata subsp. lyrata]|eukprot:XP_020890253.1 importin subunit alpha-1-like [Arabidopsis lyrata subsp. lyrata]
MLYLTDKALVDSETMKSRAEEFMEQNKNKAFADCGTSKPHHWRWRGMQGNRILNIEDMIRSGVVARFAYLLHYEDYPQLQCEAARGLAIFAAYIPDVVVDHNVVPILVTLVASSRDYYVRQQAIWALGTVAYHRRHRDYVLKCGALRPLLIQLYKDTNLSMLRIATWTLSNLCHGMPPPTFDEVKPALEIHLNSSDEEVLRYVCCAIAFLCDGSEDGIQSVIEAGFVPKLVKILRHPSKYVLGPVLHTIGTIVTGNNHQSQSVIDANLIPPLVNLAQNAEFEIKKEAVCAISNATVGGSPNQIKYLVEKGCTKPLCDLLVCPDVMIISVCLDGLENILKAREAEKNTGDVNYYCQLIEDAKGVEKIENLLKHESNEIYDKALKILETYWDVEEDDEETQQPPR